MVFCIYNLCTLDAQGLLMLIFDLYDADSSGSMSTSRAALICRYCSGCSMLLFLAFSC